MKCKNLPLRLRDGAKSGGIIRRAKYVGSQTGVRLSTGVVVKNRSFGSDLFLYILSINQPVKHLHVFDEFVDDAQIKSTCGHAPEQRQRFLPLHALAIRPITPGSVIEINHRDDSR